MTFAVPPQLPQYPDPFEPTGDPGRYVPRPATERALSELLACMSQEGGRAILPGAPGTGKTLLLRLLAQNATPGLRCVLLPYAALPLPALCAWALDLMGESASYDPVGAVIGHARRDDDEAQGLALLIDNAESIGLDTARELARAADTSGGALRLVAACEESGVRLLQTAWPGARLVPGLGPLSAEETATYLAAHLGGLAPEIVERAGFDADAAAELHRASGGVPARLSALASRRLLRAVRGAERPSPEATPPPAPMAPSPEPEIPAPAPDPPAARLPEPPPLPPPPAWALDEEQQEESEAPGLAARDAPAPSPDSAVSAPAPETIPPASASADPVPAALAPEEDHSALERAAGRLALAHSPGGHGVPSEGLEPGFERAVGRLALSQGMAGADADDEPGDAPASPEDAPPPARPRRAGRRAAAVFAAAFVLGLGASLLRTVSPPEEAPAPEAAAAPAPPSPAVPDPPLAVEPGPETPPPRPAAPAPAPVAVGINARPWATIHVDGREVGVTPLSGVELSPGLHRFEAHLPDGRVIEREVRIDRDNRFVVFP